MDLAAAETLFRQYQNFKATGICLNNIANLQYKNRQFLKAAQNFQESITQCQEHSIRLRHNDPERYEFEKVLAHRFYQKTMAIYKLMRFDSTQQMEGLTWQKVDKDMERSIAKYYVIRDQYTFYDFIVKLMLHRVYVNYMQKKLLTAEKILDNSNILIEKLESRKIRLIAANRMEAMPIPLCILRQRYFLIQGILMMAFNKEKEAKQAFDSCLTVGDIYDPRLKKECFEYKKQLYEKLVYSVKEICQQLQTFEHKTRDIVFAINTQFSMHAILPQI